MLFLLPSLALGATLPVPSVYPTVNDALAVAIAGDIIELAPGSYCEDIDFDVPVTLQGSSAETVTIDGTCGSGTALVLVRSAASGTAIQDLTIDGKSAFAGLVIEAGAEATAQGVTIINGYSATDGGGIDVASGAQLTCTDCRVESSSANRGGGVYAAGTVDLIDSVLCANDATDGGGAYLTGSSSFVRTAIVRNTAGRGGGMWVTGYGGHQVHNSVLLENVQTGDPNYGSAIFVSEAIDLRSSILVANTGSDHAFDNDDEVTTGGYNLFADNLPTGPAEVLTGDLLGASVNFVDPGLGCAFDLSLDADLPNDGFGAGDPSLGAVGGPSDAGLDFVTPFTLDSDGDGFLDVIDCDTTSSSTYPGALEVCDGIDNDCFEGVPSSEIDDDGDGFANCEGDCADSDVDVYPGAPLSDTDVGDGIDRDCNGFDECFVDGDLDGYGTSSYADADATDVCLAGTADLAGDCDDDEALSFPGNPEVCDGIDNDCNGEIDSDDAGLTDGTVWYLDVDGDGHGDPGTSLLACDAPAMYVALGDDCDDANAARSPSLPELCNGFDDDCDLAVDDDDDDAIDPSTWFLDDDGDGFGDLSVTLEACDMPSGYVADSSDCDDADSDENPGATEVCDGVDNDCDGNADDSDDDVVGQSSWYADDDADGHGAVGAMEVLACDRPLGTAATADDCDDSAVNTFPTAPEQCDGADNDCDTLVDEDVVFLDWWPDGDSDGFGDPAATPFNDCVAPPGTVSNDLDCNDASALQNPAIPELPCDGVDNDCNPSTSDDNGYCDTGDTGGTVDTGLPTDTDTDTDTDADADADADADTDTDSDADADTDADTDADADADGTGTANPNAPDPTRPDYGCGCSSSDAAWGLEAFVRRR